MIAFGCFVVVFNPGEADSPAKSNASLHVHSEGATNRRTLHPINGSKIQRLWERLNFPLRCYARWDRDRWVSFNLSFSRRHTLVLRPKVFSPTFLHQMTTFTNDTVLSHTWEDPSNRITCWYIRLAPSFIGQRLIIDARNGLPWFAIHFKTGP